MGTFVSPHLADVKERFLYDGEQVAEADFEASFQKVLSVVKTMTGRGYCHPTFFEFVYLMAMVIYEQLKPDYVVLETGLGGRLDTTNVIRRPLACVITSISLDHIQYLGSTVEEIAAEKSGIIKSGVPVIYDDNRAEASAVIAGQAQKLRADAYPVNRSEAYREVEFAAPYQAMNAALAVKVLEVLKIPGVDRDTIRRGLAHVVWPGRMQQVLPGVWLDGAHNPGGIQAFIDAVKAQNTCEEHGGSEPQTEETAVQLLFAAVSDKDYREMVRMLCTGLSISRVTVVQLSSERGLDANLLAELFREAGCQSAEQYGTVSEALAAALKHKGEKDRLYVVGSLYLIGEIEAELAGTKA